MFENYVDPELKWDSDEVKSNIEIDTINNFNKKVIQAKPRILISRGSHIIDKTGLSDNMMTSKGPRSELGLTKETKLVLINGTVQILIQSRFEGTCEKITDYTEHFLVWAAQFLCNTQGFKTFGLPLQVSPCTPNREDNEIFEVSLGIPWSMEESWSISDDAIVLKNINFSID
jgi:hypothetical protein